MDTPFWKDWQKMTVIASGIAAIIGALFAVRGLKQSIASDHDANVAWHQQVNDRLTYLEQDRQHRVGPQWRIAATQP